jgi:AraC family transcriptional regulator
MFQEIRTLTPERIVHVDRPMYGEGAEEGPRGAWLVLERYVAEYALAGRTTYGLGAVLDSMETEPQSAIRYRAAYRLPDSAPLPAGAAQEGLSEGGKFAVFLYTGPYDGLPDAWGRVMNEAFPATGLSLRDAPFFEMYLDDPSTTAPEQLRTEIFVPVE